MAAHARLSALASSARAGAGKLVHKKGRSSEDEETYDEYSARMKKLFSPESVHKATRDKPAAYTYTRKTSYTRKS